MYWMKVEHFQEIYFSELTADLHTRLAHPSLFTICPTSSDVSMYCFFNNIVPLYYKLLAFWSELLNKSLMYEHDWASKHTKTQLKICEECCEI